MWDVDGNSTVSFYMAVSGGLLAVAYSGSVNQLICIFVKMTIDIPPRTVTAIFLGEFHRIKEFQRARLVAGSEFDQLCVLVVQLSYYFPSCKLI